tara:strand:+ start:10 stop:627 length:618 start_codon:yes stop_codon:yes gene_type:complete
MKLLLSFALLASPVIADESYYTPRAMSCMKEQVCTVGVDELDASDYTGEANSIITNLDEMGVKVYNASPEYFIKNYRAVYFADKNAVYINKKYIDGDGDLSFLEILRHEGWHAAQDCMGGGMNTGVLKSIFSHVVIPEEITQETFARYGFDPTVVRIEREAVWAMKVEGMTLKALKACNSNVPMWETYFPPKRTWQYLYWNGFIK